MTMPPEPPDAASSPSDTGWPVDTGEPLPPLETSDPTDAEEEGWPSLPAEEAEPEPEPEPELAYEPEPEPEQEPEPEPEPEPELEPVPIPVYLVAPPPPPRRPLGVPATVLALVLTTLLMAIANGFVWYRVHDHSATDSARRAGLEASRDAARVLFSYDYRQLPKDFAAGKALTTGAFRKQYTETTTKVVTPVATDKKAVVKAEVVTAGVVRATPKAVVTIVYVNQVTTSSLEAAPKVDLSRVRMTMAKVDGHWLVAKVDAL